MNLPSKPVGYAAVEWNGKLNELQNLALTYRPVGGFIYHLPKMKLKFPINIERFLKTKLLILIIQQIFIFLFAYSLLKITKLYCLYRSYKYHKYKNIAIEYLKIFSDK